MELKSLYRIPILLAACFLALATSCNRPQRVVIVSTNDMHSSIDNFPRLATLVDSLRQAEGDDNVILADAGDRWTGNPFVDLAEKPLYPIIQLMNTLEYDVATLGNHEFDWGQEMLDERIDESDFEVVCANLQTGDSELDPIPPYTFVEAGGLRICFFGLVTNFVDGHPDGKDESFTGLTFPDPYETAERYAGLKDSCDVFVAITHIGDDADSILATRIPQLDLILGGHTHTVLSTPRKVGNTTITQTGSKLKYAGITTIERRDGRLTVDNRLVRLDTISESEGYTGMIKVYKTNERLLTPICRLDRGMGRAEIVNLVTDAIREATSADVALYHNGGIRIDTIPAGGISTADLFRIEPFRSEIYTAELTPGALKGLIINKFNDTENPRESHGPDIWPAGLSYRIVTDESGDATDVVFNGPARTSYKVAMPDYMFKMYDFVRPAKFSETGMQVTDILTEHLAANFPPRSDETVRISID